MQKQSNDFDPCALFPSRIRRKMVTAKPASSGPARGSYSHRDKTALIPITNTAYDRTVRLHESLHAIYTKRKPDGTNLSQGLEDARLHLNYAKTAGNVRRDELATALKDLHRIPANKDLAAILALRSAAILDRGFGDRGSRLALDAADKNLRRMQDAVAPDYHAAVTSALELLRKEDFDSATAVLKPFFSEAKKEDKPFPQAGKGKGKDGEGKEDKEFADVSFEKLEGKITSDAADMLGGDLTKLISESTRMPKLNIHQLFANYSIPTFFGETEKHTLSGCRIDAKKLALVVGPAMPRIFTKTIHRNGGTVVIDASGSMEIDATQLLALLTSAPMATIGFYNANTDTHWQGNLWIFAHKGKRAIDLRDVKMDCRTKEELDLTFGYGNVVDFQAIQWLLAQPAPRYILTDGKFCGPSRVSNDAADQLLRNAIARKKLIQITSIAEMAKVLAGKGQTL